MRSKRIMKMWESGRRNCYFCGIRLCLDVEKPNHMTIDHIIPKSAGGISERNNYAPSCKPCNGAKAALTERDFRVKRGVEIYRKRFPNFPLFD